MCQAQGRAAPATVVDHIRPHRGDAELFWNADNWQSLCAHHHSKDKQSQERQAERGNRRSSR
ncbi:HNH endonuclease signature motif containing protein [Kaistia sp. UC242_56]|uniref:HNH endonuclease signature motif containing protein n=1 Tax=Kaistia sp. UC242_56 TaxID=3374625 RepID=UPI0037A4E7F7